MCRVCHHPPPLCRPSPPPGVAQSSMRGPAPDQGTGSGWRNRVVPAPKAGVEFARRTSRPALALAFPPLRGACRSPSLARVPPTSTLLHGDRGCERARLSRALYRREEFQQPRVDPAARSRSVPLLLVPAVADPSSVYTSCSPSPLTPPTYRGGDGLGRRLLSFLECARAPKSSAAESCPISTMPRRMPRVRVKCSNSASPSPRRIAPVAVSTDLPRTRRAFPAPHPC